jgi:hypothetical protein
MKAWEGKKKSFVPSGKKWIMQFFDTAPFWCLLPPVAEVGIKAGFVRWSWSSERPWFTPSWDEATELSAILITRINGPVWSIFYMQNFLRTRLSPHYVFNKCWLLYCCCLGMLKTLYQKTGLKWSEMKAIY